FTRSYDSADRGIDGELGYGWRFGLDFSAVESRNDFANVPISAHDDQWDSSNQTVPVRVGGDRDVWLTMPDGRRARFKYLQESNFARFISPPGVNATLEPLRGDHIISSNGQLYFSRTPPAGSEDAFAVNLLERHEFSGYALTMADGTRFILEKEESPVTRDLGPRAININGLPDNTYGYIFHHYEGQPKLTAIETADGRRIRFTEDGIISNTGGFHGLDLEIERDWLNRITKLYGPVDPDTAQRRLRVQYEYDTGGDLVAVTRYTEDGVGDTTTFHYGQNSTGPHYLSGITDARGVEVLRTEVGSDGRISQVRDASGSAIDITYTTDNDDGTYRETLTTAVDDSTSYTTEMVYDQFGNALREIRELEGGNYQVTIREFDASGNPTLSYEPFVIEAVNASTRFDPT
ncbi:MAG: hypothetical protein AAGK78_13385, partial [Planctomycetota bacterium]